MMSQDSKLGRPRNMVTALQFRRRMYDAVTCGDVMCIPENKTYDTHALKADTNHNAAVNGLFGKLLNLAKEVILELVRAKCIPIQFCYMV